MNCRSARWVKVVFASTASQATGVLLVLGVFLLSPEIVTATPRDTGSWSSLIPWTYLPTTILPSTYTSPRNLIAAHASVLPPDTNGNRYVLLWGVNNREGEGNRYTATFLFDQTFDPAVQGGTGLTQGAEGLGIMMCAGHSMLGDGSLLVIAGEAPSIEDVPCWSNLEGTRFIRRYKNGTWTNDPLLELVWQRWYPTITTMTEGRAFVFAGDTLRIEANNCVRDHVKDSEFFSLHLPDVSIEHETTGVNLLQENYPPAHLLPTNQMLYAGYQTPYILNFTSMVWEAQTTTSGLSFDGASVALNKDKRFVRSGGWIGAYPTNDVWYLDVSSYSQNPATATLDWEHDPAVIRDFNHARSNHNMLLTATGELLAVVSFRP